ncbi:tetratricopeptide repeat protein [Fodinibius halophilus]|uniref:Tetratricopeptide repeat protein n=1 Tax=Fodinibius halophilus TaxID=1736908 RepID=A0A6M1TFG3_9BACT|nr:tetratricopeptide repeat protein [Fodinibius halophilus]NGP88872.1 tetratricopeptide repeat protein [Fodinibius halophilus]
MSKKQVKEELEQDILLETFSKAQNLYDNNKSALIGAAIALIVLIGGSVGYYYYSTAQENEAQQLMAKATQAYLNQDYQTALTGSDTQFTVGFEQIVNNFPLTDAANLASYYASVCEFNLGNTQEALNYITEYEVPEGILGVAPIAFHGVIHTELGNHEKAADIYIKAAEWDKNESTTPYNYLEAARAYQDAGNTDKAREYAQKVVDEHDQSSHVTTAEKLLGTLAVAQ